MSGSNDPVLHSTEILDLRPTQLTVGFVEVRRKRETWADKTGKALEQFLASHMVPVVIGPKDNPYLIDHHHLALALLQEDVRSVFINVVADLSRLSPDQFWTVMDVRSWTYPYDEDGRRRPFSDMPKTVKKLSDDPYRSLAGEVRDHGGFAKESTPFAEFLWADFFRPRVKAKTIAADFDAALAEALRFAKSPEADYLPGWSGPHPYAKATAGKKS